MIRRSTSLLAALLCTALLFTGCNKNESSSKDTKAASPKLAFVPNNPSEFWKIAQAGLKKFTSETGVPVTMETPTNGKVEEQNQIIENLLSQGYNGISVSVLAPDDQIAELNRACKKAHVICHDSDAPKSERLAYVGTDNYAAGKKLGEAIVKLLPNGGDIAVFVGTFSADNAQQRLKGIQDVITPKGIKIAVQREDNGDRTLARSNVENVINAYPNVKLMCGLWSYNGPAIAKAIEGAGKKGQILAAVFDQEDGTLVGIENGTINCTAVQNPFQIGYESAMLLYKLGKDGMTALPPDKKIDTGVDIIDGSNIKEYRKQMADWLK